MNQIDYPSYLPSEAVLNQWEKLSESPIVGNVPRLVPMTTMIEMPEFDYYNNIPATCVEIPAKEQLICLDDINSLIQKIEDHIYFFYQYRAHLNGLKKEIDSSNLPDEQIVKSLNESIENLKKFVTNASNDCHEAVSFIASIFLDSERWKNGMYFDLLIDRICFLYFRLYTTNSLLAVNSGIFRDLDCLEKLLRSKHLSIDELDFEYNVDKITFQQIKVPSTFKVELLNSVGNKIQIENFEPLFNIFWEYISHAITTKNFIYSDYETAYISMLLFFIDLYTSLQNKYSSSTFPTKFNKKISNEVMKFVLDYRSKHPALSLIFDLNIDIDQLSNQLSQIQKNDDTKPEFPLLELRNELFHILHKISHDYSSITTTDSPYRDKVMEVINEIPTYLHCIGKAIYTIRELIFYKHNHASKCSPKNDENNSEVDPVEQNDDNKRVQSDFEIAMTQNLNSDEKELIMNIIAISRSFRELILGDLPKIQSIFSNYIQNFIQEYVKTIIPNSLSNNKVDDTIKNDFELLQTICSTPSSKSSNTQFDSSPHIGYINLLRCFIQNFLNREPKKNNFLKNVFSYKKTDEFSQFKEFLVKSKFFVDILQLGQAVSCVCDQSSLFFKEIYLDLYRSKVMHGDNNSQTNVVYFLVTSSLPYLLIDNTINSSDQSKDLSGTIFYPLSIYNDSAACALRLLKSKFLYEEICTEADTCLNIIAYNISAYAFDFVYKVFLEREKLLEDNSHSIKTQYNLSLEKISMLLKQNQLFLLGNYCDIKALFAKQITKQFTKNIDSILKMISNFEVACFLIFSKTMEIYKEMHHFFLNCGLPLAEFDEIAHQSFQIESPNSFNSFIFQVIKTNIEDNIIPEYYLFSNPLRLHYPPDKTKLIHNTLLAFKNQIPNHLETTTNFIDVSHFREIFNYIDEGGVYILVSMLKDSLKKAFAEFLSSYEDIKGVVQRVPDCSLEYGKIKAYNRFETAYISLTKNEKVNNLFSKMRKLGNIIGIAQIMDETLLIRRTSINQFLSYLFSSEPYEANELFQNHSNKTTSSPFENIFDKHFSDNLQFFKHQLQEDGSFTVAPNKNQIIQSFLQSILNLIYQEVIQQDVHEHFEETSSDLLDSLSLNGFSAYWSVLEFVFCLKEMHRIDKRIGNNCKIMTANKKNSDGDRGIIYFASVLIYMMKQTSMYNIMSICSKISTYRDFSYSDIESESIFDFLSCYERVKSSYHLFTHIISQCMENVMDS